MVTNKNFKATPAIWSGPQKGVKAPRQSWHDFRVEGNYVGPGNRTDVDYQRKYPPLNARDYAAYKHDLYGEPYDYLHFNNADVDFLKDIKNVSGVRARAYEGYFKAKRALTRPRFRSRVVSRRSGSYVPESRYRRRRRRKHFKKFVKK